MRSANSARISDLIDFGGYPFSQDSYYKVQGHVT